MTDDLATRLAAVQALFALALFVTPVAAGTLVVTERHLELDTLSAHVTPNAMAYVVQGGQVVPIDPHAFIVTGREVRLTLPDRTIRCPLHARDRVLQAGRVADVTPTERLVTTWRVARWDVDCTVGTGTLTLGRTTYHQTRKDLPF